MSNPNLVVVDELNGADSRGGLGRFTIRNAVVHEATIGERLGWQKCENHKLRLFCTEADEIVDWAGHICREGVHQELEHVCVDGWTPPAELVERAAKQIHGGNFKGSLADAKAVLLEQARWIGEQ